LTQPNARALCLRVLLALAGTAASTACIEPPPPLSLPPGCQPLLAGFDCFLPYPSDFFRVADPSMPSGFRLHHEDASKLYTDEGWSADINDFLPMDGASRVPNIVALLGVEVRDEGLTHIFDDPEGTQLPSSRTLLLDAETGLPVAHFVDLDPRASAPDRQALVFHPLLRLREQHRYVVVLQGLIGRDGAPAPAPEGYRRLRDGLGAHDPALAALAARYESAVFPVLQRFGVDRQRTQLVWDFTTGADAWAVTDMMRARELALGELAARPPEVQIDAVFENGSDASWRTIRGKVTGPLVLDEIGGPGEHLARDELGRVRLNGRTTFDFTAVIPAVVRDGFAAGVPLLYGHGFFGAQGEIENPVTPRVLQGVGAVGFAVDWAGMAGDDLGVVISAVGGDVWRSLEFGERLPQAMVNFLTLRVAISGPLQDQPAFRRPDELGAEGVIADPADPDRTNAGALVYAGRVAYMGMSQGHILGGVLAALDPELDRVVLTVGGAGYTHMMMRASPFKQYLKLYDLSVPDPLDQQKVIATLSRGFDRFDPVAYASYVLQEEVPFGPPSGRARRRVLLQIGLGDTQVPNFTAWLHARLLEVPVVTPTPLLPWGLDEVSAPHVGSGMTVWSFGVDESFARVASPPTEGNRVHEGLRTSPLAQAQIHTFLREGVIKPGCGDEPCVLE
jgi:hypothetical protein